MENEKSTTQANLPEARRGVSRRGFLSGAALAAGAAAVAGLAGCAPQAAGEAAGEASTAGGDAMAATGAMQTTDPSKAVWPVVEEVEVGSAGEGEIAFVAEPIAADEITATHDVDVVVCGLGPAGDAAALACAEQGLKVVAVEKQSRGNYNSATIGGTNSKLHEHWGMTYDTDAWIADAMVDNAFQGDMTLFKHFLEKNGEAVDWYISHFDNQNLDDYPLTFAAGDFPDFRDEWDKTALSRSWNTSLNLPYPPGELADILAGILTEAGVEIRFNTPACQLVTDDAGKVTGVIVKGEGGYEQYNCAKGVVLATGGYEFNQQMLKERCRPRGVPGAWLTGAFGNTGDGLQMGIAVGAAEDEFPQPIMLDPEQLMPYLRVNKLGKRFTPEYEPYGHLAMAIQAQPGTYDFYVVDGAIGEKIDKIWTPSSSCYGPKEVWVGAATSENALKADTLEELAELMEVPADDFVATINRWNEMAAAGKDEDFNFPGEMMMTIDTPPFYATKEHADGLCTAGGLLVDTACRVLDKERQPIEGLFAAGIVSGGMFYNTYPHNLNCLSHTRNCLMGYTIGQVLGGKEA
ncbi:MAG: FAD-dependent oxidoreductase [Adlercreutzia caecimuris]|jgi:fumarate reductase flavoprotein subunit|uniref:FAD-dependent oxidoreductase n=1 Tax=Adlercreutzia caecimuris TaxID=671266 RepID=UPI002431E732|nr:FAD-dependent oxidoreductase [Adlercreutzia caecimuris]MCI9207157.1 FAD-dependent oxidoreductase [Adlercreutzia caecimuris]